MGYDVEVNRVRRPSAFSVTAVDEMLAQMAVDLLYYIYNISKTVYFISKTIYISKIIYIQVKQYIYCI